MIRSLRKLRQLPFDSLLRQQLMLKSYLLRGGRVVNSDLSERADVLIKDGKIESVGTVANAAAAEVIDCQGKLIIPGGIDTHTHMQ